MTVSDGKSEDMLRSIQQLVCTEGHYKTLVEKYSSELENGLIEADDMQAKVEQLNDAVNELNLIAGIRRRMMLRLMNDYTGHNKDMWCTVKHLSSASYCAFEVYQASDNDGELLNLWLETNARFIKAVTLWLGTEVTDCAACAQDILRAEKGERNG